MAKKDNTVWWVIGVIAVLVILVGGGIGIFNKKCVGEFEQIGTGIAMNTNEKCCSGLVLKAPEGFTGGAWCVKPQCNVYCLTGNELLIGIEGEGIYADCPDRATLLKQTSCQ